MKIVCTGKDGKSETLREEQIPTIAPGKTANFKIELTDKKYFDKDLKWTLEISSGDGTVTNDEKGPIILSPGAPPKG